MFESQTRPTVTQIRQETSPVIIGEFTFLPSTGVLQSPDGEKRLNAKTLHVLLVLLEHVEQGVSREDILKQVWGASYPSDSVVSRAIADLRSVFGEKAGQQKYIRTIPKFGYQLIAKTSEVPATSHIKSSTSPATTAIIQRGIDHYFKHVSVIVLMLLLVFIVFKSEVSEPLATKPIVLGDYRLLTFAPGIEHQPRLSPDGQWLLYAAKKAGSVDWNIFRVSMDGAITQDVATQKNEHEHGPAFSPSGKEVSYVRLNNDGCEVIAKSFRSEESKVLANCTQRFATTTDWMPKGNWIAFTSSATNSERNARNLSIVDYETGEVQLLTEGVSATGTDYYPRFSPSAKNIAFLRGEPQPDHRTTIWIVNLESKAESPLVELPARIGGLTWIDEERILYSEEEAGRFQMHVIDINTKQQINLQREGFIQADYHFESSTLAAVKRRNQRDLIRVGPKGVALPIAVSTEDDHSADISADGKWVVFVSKRTGFDEIWLASTQTEAVRQLTRFEGATLRYPDWHPDGEKVLFTVQTDGDEIIYEVNVLSGLIAPLERNVFPVTSPKWMPNGTSWAFACQPKRIWGICLNTGEEVIHLGDDLYRPMPMNDDSIMVVGSDSKLYRFDMQTMKKTATSFSLPDNARNAWTIDEEYVIYISSTAQSNKAKLIKQHIVNQTSQVLYEGAMQLADGTITINALSKEIVVTKVSDASDDIVLFSQPQLSKIH